MSILFNVLTKYWALSPTQFIISYSSDTLFFTLPLIFLDYESETSQSVFSLRCPSHCERELNCLIRNIQYRLGSVSISSILYRRRCYIFSDQKLQNKNWRKYTRKPCFKISHHGTWNICLFAIRKQSVWFS